MTILVSDAGPIIHLAEAGILSLLKPVGNICVPWLVQREVVATLGAQSVWPQWIKVLKLTPEQQQKALMWRKIGDLHGGEAEAFVLAQSCNAQWFLTDDAAARLFAAANGMEVHGSLWLSRKVWAEALDAADEICHMRTHAKKPPDISQKN